jgi:hypothetical protein
MISKIMSKKSQVKVLIKERTRALSIVIIVKTSYSQEEDL